MDAQGHIQDAIAKTLGISIETLTRAKCNMRDFGDIEASKQKRRPKSKMDLGMQEVDLCTPCFF
jgi:transposase